MRARSNSTLALPYMARVSVFSLLICPSAWPLLQRVVRAFCTASKVPAGCRGRCRTRCSGRAPPARGDGVCPRGSVLAASAAAAWAGGVRAARSRGAARERLCRADGSLSGGAAGQGSLGWLRLRCIGLRFRTFGGCRLRWRASAPCWLNTQMVGNWQRFCRRSPPTRRTGRCRHARPLRVRRWPGWN
jgi:hypothetical protein